MDLVKRFSLASVLTSSILVQLLLPGSAVALVDMKNANYSDTWTDIEVPGTGFDLRVTRSYNSRSLFNGIFGFGWCSNFETALDTTAEGNLKLIQCGDGQETLYFPKSFASKDVAKTVDAIIAEEKKSKQKQPEKYYVNLKKSLESDPSMRAEYTKKLGLKKDVTEGTEFFSAAGSVDSIVRKKDFYQLSLTDGTTQRFDLQGRMIQINDKSGNFLKLNYRGESLAEMIDNNGRKLTINYNQNKKVKEILGPNNVKATYEYKDVSNLASSKNMWNNLFSYEYDDLHNLVKISYPDGTFKALTYDKVKDWVLSYRERDACLESYEYTSAEDDPKNHYFSSVVKKCGDKVVNRSKFEFWFKLRPDKAGNYLERVSMDVNGDKSDITYHENFGKPVKMVRNGRITLFTYFDNGLVKSRTIGKDVTSFKYDKKTNKVSEVANGKKLTQFDYDTKGNLLTAKNNQGQLIKLTYDAQGRIAAIVDQAKRQVNIKYEERFGKPRWVERVGMGSINVTYKPTGEIEKVDSSDGPTVAVQVASSFNNLLEMIQPAGIEMGL
jgi:YD repeat-containing protein